MSSGGLWVLHIMQWCSNTMDIVPCVVSVTAAPPTSSFTSATSPLSHQVKWFRSVCIQLTISQDIHAKLACSKDHWHSFNRILSIDYWHSCHFAPTNFLRKTPFMSDIKHAIRFPLAPGSQLPISGPMFHVLFVVWSSIPSQVGPTIPTR